MANSVVVVEFLMCRCGNLIGTLVPVNGEKWLDIEHVVELRNGHGRCSRCQAIWHYDALDGRLDDLVKRVAKGRDEETHTSI